MNNLIQQMATKTMVGKTITGTNIPFGETISLVPINGVVAEAIRTLDKVELFGKGSAFFKVGFVRETIDGFIFKRNDFTAALALDEKGLEFDILYVNRIPNDEEAHFLIQAAILLILETEFKTLDWKNDILSIQALNFIQLGTNEANSFANIVRTIENSINAGIFNVFEFEVKDDLETFDVKNVLPSYGLNSAVSVSYEEDEIEDFDDFDFEESDIDNDEVKVENSKVEEEIVNEQTSLFDDDKLSDFEKFIEREGIDSSLTPDDMFELPSDLEDESDEEQKDFTSEEENNNVVALHPSVQTENVTVYEVAELIKAQKATLDALSELTGVSKSTLSTIQTLKRTNIKQATLQQIANAIGTSSPNTSDVNSAKTEVPTAVPTVQQEEALNNKFKELNQSFNDASKNPQMNFNMDEFFAKLSKVLAEAVSQGFKPVIESEKTEEEENVVDIQQLKEARPRFFDDTWVEELMKSFNLTQKDIDDTLAFRKEIRTWLVENYPEVIFEVEPDFTYLGYDEPVETAVDAVLEDLNLLLKGEAGAGKTTLVQSISCLFNLPLFTINGSDESNIETIVGFKEIKDGKIVFKEGRLIKAMIVGALFYGDEANMIRPNILAIINGALDHRRELYNEFVGKRIKAKKWFRAMFSINEDYEDTREMNKATLDRSIAFEMSYMTIEQLKDLLRRLDPDMSERDIRMLAQIANALQQGVRDEMISPEVASIRNIIYLQKMVRRRSFEKSLKRIIHKYKKEERSAIVAILSNVDRLDISAEDILSAV